MCSRIETKSHQDPGTFYQKLGSTRVHKQGIQDWQDALGADTTESAVWCAMRADGPELNERRIETQVSLEIFYLVNRSACLFLVVVEVCCRAAKQE